MELPIVLHIWCECGRVGKVETDLHADHHAIFRRARCKVCRSYGLRGHPVNAVLGWADESNWNGKGVGEAHKDGAE
ncbi:MAG: hypothetical protein EpisKO_41850 [Epibacterium sp.]